MGGKPPRFTREGIERALADLTARIKLANEDPAAPHRITEAVAFGDFLIDRARVQAAEVGIELQSRSMTTAGDYRSAIERSQEIAFLKQLRGTATMLHIQP